jgi:hypothetical protein
MLVQNNTPIESKPSSDTKDADDGADTENIGDAKSHNVLAKLPMISMQC